MEVKDGGVFTCERCLPAAKVGRTHSERERGTLLKNMQDTPPPVSAKGLSHGHQRKAGGSFEDGEAGDVTIKNHKLSVGTDTPYNRFHSYFH